MSFDREQDHLDNMSGMNGSRHFSKGQYGGESYLMDPLHIALYYTHKFLTAQRQPTMTAMEWMRSNPTIPCERQEVIDEDKFRAKFNLAPRRL